MAKTSTHRQDLQGLRGIAVLLVVFYHAGDIIPGGFIGVDVFFVLSGFVIGASMLRESDRTGSISLSNFYARRVRRILPAMALMTVVTLLVFAYTMSPFGNQQVMTKTSGAASVWLSNMALAQADGGGYFAPGAEENPFLHTWSLGVEEQFYIFLPIAMALIFVSLVRWRGMSTRRIQVTLGTVALLSLALSIALVDRGLELDPGIDALEFDSAKLGFYFPLSRFWELLAGVLLATSVLASRPVPRAAAVGAAATGIAILVAVALTYDDFTPFPGQAAIPVVVATLLLIWAGAEATGPVARVMSVPPLRFIGDNSYSWYLWHWPAVVFAALMWSDSRGALLVAAALSLIPAVLSRTYLEEPIRRNTSIVGRKAVGLAVVCVGVPLVLSVAVYAGAQQRWGLDEPVGWDDIPVAREAGCHVLDVAGDVDFDADDCIFPADETTDTGDTPAGTVVVVGDSHASSLSSAVVTAANPRGYDVAVWSASGCPYILDVGPDRQFDACNRWVDAARDLIGELEPELVVVVNRATLYLHPVAGEPENPINRLSDANGDRTETRTEALELWTEATAATVADLESVGADVIVVGTVPEFWPDFVDRYSLARPDLDPVLTAEELEARQADVDAAIQAGVPDSAVFVDPTDAICPSFPCRPYDETGWDYYDPDHLNERGSVLLVDTFGRALDGLLGER